MTEGNKKHEGLVSGPCLSNNATLPLEGTVRLLDTERASDN